MPRTLKQTKNSALNIISRLCIVISKVSSIKDYSTCISIYIQGRRPNEMFNPSLKPYFCE